MSGTQPEVGNFLTQLIGYPPGREPHHCLFAGKQARNFQHRRQQIAVCRNQNRPIIQILMGVGQQPYGHVDIGLLLLRFHPRSPAPGASHLVNIKPPQHNFRTLRFQSLQV